ncbi:MAG: SulP family inorganic anion transporter [Sporichthyaceae bacterium]
MRMPVHATGDLIAGASVAVVVIPQSLAYADLAGMPPAAGLYAAALPPIAAAFLASSPYLATGPVAVTGLLTFGALSTMATPGSGEYMTLGFLLALIVGVVRIALGLLRAGWVAYLMSQPMLLGFVPAAAILIASSQLAKAVGATGVPDYDSDLTKAAWVLTHPDAWTVAAIVVTVLTLVVIGAGRRLHQLFPGILICAVVATIVSAAGSDLGPTIDNLDAGFPPFTFDDLPWSQLPDLLLAGFVIALIGFSEAASISRKFAAEDRITWSADREFVSQGVANVVAACSGGMPCGGSFSRSAINRKSGARTRFAGAVSGLLVLVFLPFAQIVEPLPFAVLGAIVISSVAGLMRFRPLIALWRLSVPQAMIAWITFIATLALAPRLDLAVMIGIGASLAVFLWRALQLDIDVVATDDLLVLTPRGVLWFGTAQRIGTAINEALVAHPSARRLELDLRGLGRIDTTGALALSTVLRTARESGIEAELVGIPKQSQALTQRILDCGDALS